MNIRPFALLLLWPALAASAAEWAPTLTTTTAWNSNVTNADRPGDTIGALQLRASGDTATRLALDTDNAVFAGVGLAVETWPRFDGLNRTELGPRLSWEHKFGLGALAPVFSIATAGEVVAEREAARRALAGRATFALRQRLDAVTRVALTYERTREQARETVFDRTGAETTLIVTRDFAQPWSVAIAARWREGTVQSYATPPRPDLIPLARMREPNTTFGRPFVVYSLDAPTLAGVLRITRALVRTTALTLAYEWRDSTRAPLSYTNHLVSAAVFHQF